MIRGSSPPTRGPPKQRRRPDAASRGHSPFPSLSTFPTLQKRRSRTPFLPSLCKCLYRKFTPCNSMTRLFASSKVSFVAVLSVRRSERPPSASSRRQFGYVQSAHTSPGTHSLTIDRATRRSSSSGICLALALGQGQREAEQQESQHNLTRAK